MIDIDLVNVDFDISKDKEHTTKYLDDLNQQTPFQVLDNTYTEHLRAVLNYGPILTVREPFAGCEPDITDSRWEGTYLYFTGEGPFYIDAIDLPNNIGSVRETTISEWDESLIVKSIALYSYPSVKEFTTSDIQVTDEELPFITHLETDFTKDGKPLTIEDLVTEQDLTFVSGSIDNHIRFWVNQPADMKSAYSNEKLTYGNVPNPVNTLTAYEGECTIEGIRVDDPEFNTKLPMLNVTLKKEMWYYPVLHEVTVYEVTASNQVTEPYKITVEPFASAIYEPTLTSWGDEVYILRNVV